MAGEDGVVVVNGGGGGADSATRATPGDNLEGARKGLVVMAAKELGVNPRWWQ